MKKTWLSIFTVLSWQIVTSQYNYPKTASRPVVDKYYGTEITDGYRWLEDIRNAEVQNWFKEQSDYTKNVLQKVGGREELFKSLKQLQEYGGDRFGKIMQRGANVYYAKTPKSAKTSKLYVRRPDKGEELLFDPDTIKKDLQLLSFTVDNGGKRAAVLLSHDGSEVCEIRFIEIGTRKTMADILYPVWSEFNFAFSPSDDALLYTRMSKDKGEHDLLRNMCAMLHKIGTSSEKDVVIASAEKCPQLAMLPEQFPALSLSNDNAYLFLSVFSARYEFPVFYASANELLHGEIAWRPLIKESDAVTDFKTIGSRLFILTHKNAPNFKIACTTMSAPSVADATVIVPQGRDVISGLNSSKHYLYYTKGNGIEQDCYQVHSGTLETRKIPLPGGVNYCFPLNAMVDDQMLAVNQGWLNPGTTYDYTPDGKLPLKKSLFDAGGNYPDFNSEFEIKETEVKGHDGEMIPLSIIYPKKLVRDGSSYCLITGYGAYGYSNQAFFLGDLAALLSRRVIIAVAHVRGGGEKGEAWHTAGMKMKKPNTWKDFISCTEFLVSEKYTSPGKLIGSGMSMGGILIGRSITERPDLFAAVICEAGVTNALRMETSPNGQNQIPEIGTLKNKEDTKGILEMDAQSKVRKGEKYPAVIVRCGMNDDRVPPWMAAKFASVLQNNSSSGRPVLLHVNYNNGHFTEDRHVTLHDNADMFAFALWQVGHPGFQVGQ